jgi:hypothetical protein
MVGDDFLGQSRTEANEIGFYSHRKILTKKEAFSLFFLEKMQLSSDFFGDHFFIFVVTTGGTNVVGQLGRATVLALSGFGTLQGVV